MSEQELQGIGWRYLFDDAQILYLHVNSEGNVINANCFTGEHIIQQGETTSLDEVFLSFTGPIDVDHLRSDPGRTHLMHVPTNGGLPETLKVNFFPFGEDTLVFGQFDAHETKRLHKELIKLNNQLSALTRDLQKKNHELEELNQLKNQFLGMAAHDLRKPVGAILNYSEFLIDETGNDLNEEHFGFLKTIHSSTDLMLQVIDDFLDIAIIEAGRLELDKQMTDISVPIEKSVELNSLPARTKGVKLSVVFDEQACPVMMDHLKIEQVLNNLISNAIEHSPPGSEVKIRTSSDSEFVQIAVKDAGHGITHEDRAALFKPFARGSTRKAHGEKSTGLGLSISKKIVEAHWGKIWTEDAEGSGAVFALSLPINQSEKLNDKG